MEERLLKLDKHFEAGTSKKQQRSELMINGSTGALNMKITTRMKSVEDRPKNIRINKRARTTSVTEFQAEYQINSLKKHPVAVAKDVKFLKNNGKKSDQFEKNSSLAALEEGWDKKIKRKRSIGTILSKPVDSDGGVPKRAIQNRVADERGVKQHDSHKSRSNNCDENYTTCHSPLSKKKLLRTTQIGSHAHETLEKWENAFVKETETLISQERDNNCKPSFGQWVGQRAPKVTRTRRSNLVPPGSNQDGTHRNAANGSLKIVVKLDKLQTGVKESVGGGEGKTKGKMGKNEVGGFHVEGIGTSVTLAKKNKCVVSEEGRSARGLLISRCSKSPMGKEFDKSGTPKLLLQGIESGSKKNASKGGRRLKRLSEYKGLSNDFPLQNSSSPDSTGDSDYDKEELQSAANHPRIPSPCSSPLWKKKKKKKEPNFSPITCEEKSLLYQQLGLDAAPIYEKTKTPMPRQQPESVSKKHDLDHDPSNEYTPFYQRVLSALIIEDDEDDFDGLLLEADARNTQTQNSFSVSTSDTYHHLNDSDPRKKPRVENSCDTTFSICGQSLRLTKKPFTSTTNVSTLYEEDVHCQYEKMSVDDRLLLELQCIGLCLDTLPGLEDNEDEYIPNQVDNLQTPLHQQGSRRSSRFGIPEVRKQVARSHKFEISGKSCFNEIPLKDILPATIEKEPDPKIFSDEASGVNQPTSNTGKNKKVLFDNGGTTTSGRTKGKRSNRAATKPPRAPQPKPRQKTDQPPTPKGKSVNKPTEPPQPSGNNRRDIRFASRARTEGNDQTTPAPAPLVEELDPVDKLGVVGGPHDLDSLLSFNEEDDLDLDFAEGLAIPDDDLTGLSLF